MSRRCHPHPSPLPRLLPRRTLLKATGKHVSVTIESAFWPNFSSDLKILGYFYEETIPGIRRCSHPPRCNHPLRWSLTSVARPAHPRPLLSNSWSSDARRTCPGCPSASHWGASLSPPREGGDGRNCALGPLRRCPPRSSKKGGGCVCTRMTAVPYLSHPYLITTLPLAEDPSGTDHPPTRVIPLPFSSVAVGSRRDLVLAFPVASVTSTTEAVGVPGVVLDVLGRGIGNGNYQRKQCGSDEEAAALGHADKNSISTVSL